MTAFLFPPPTGDYEHDRTVRLLNPALWIMFFGAVISTALGHYVAPTRPEILASVGVYSLALLVLRHWMIRGSVRTVSFIAVASSWLLISYMIVKDGIQSPVSGAFIPITMIAAATLGGRVALALAGCASGFLLLAVQAETSGWITPERVEITSISYAVVSSFQIILVGVLATILMREHDRAIRRINTYVRDAPDGLLTTDAQGAVRDVNPALCEMWGFSREFLVGKAVGSGGSISASAAKDALDIVRRVASGADNRSSPMEICATRPDGTKFWAESIVRAVELDDGSPGSLSVVRDITRRRQAELRLDDARRLASVNQLAAGIAHDFNNILMAILATAELLRTIDAGRQHAIDVDSIIDACERGCGLTRQLLIFGGAQVTPSVDVSAVVLDLRRLLSSLVGERIQLVIHADAEANVHCDRSQLEQIVMNLVINSKEAIAKNGSIDVSVRTTEPENRRIVLCVTDDGHGMTPEIRARAFDPFFSIKRTGRGTGLGLAVVREIVEKAGGSVALESEPARGTTVTIELPASDGRSQPDHVAEPPRPLRGSETILFVEDEGSVRNAVMRLLENAGYQVLEAASAKDALAVSRSYDGPIDLLVTDVIMPIASGPDLAEELQAERAQMKVLLISGHTGDTLEPHLDTDLVVPLLYKPFTMHAILTRVREILDG